MPNNSIFTIRPFKIGSVWAFSDEELGIHNEPFCGSVNQIIDAMLLRADLPASEPFTAMFSASPFPGSHLHLEWQREEHNGNWYVDATDRMKILTSSPELLEYAKDNPPTEGWLCPVLLSFFETAPKSIFARAE